MRGESNQWPTYGRLLSETILRQAEGPGLDTKREHYYFDEGMKDNSGNQVNHLEKRAAFLTDLIALANAARSQNTPAYLWLGIAEYDDWTIWGVEGQHPKARQKPSWSDVEAHPDLMSRWVESIQNAYTGFARSFIEPGLPEIHYETGWYDGQHLLGLLVIKPSHPETGFYLTEKPQKELDLKQLRLEPGCSWRRLGATNDKIEPHQRAWMLKSYQQYPYIPLAGWRTYLGKLSSAWVDPVQPDRYQPLQGRFLDGRGNNKVENTAEFLDQYVHGSITSNAIIVVGAPGSGKTTLLERLTQALAIEAIQAIEATHGQPYVPGQPRALDFPKDAPVPVLIRLWGFECRSQETPEIRFRRAMTDHATESLGLDQHPSPAKLLDDRDLNFVVMLDGLDEISRRSRRNRTRSLNALAAFIQDHPHARFIVTCRSDLLADMGPVWRTYPQLHIAPMSSTQARQYLGGTTWASLLDRDDILISTLQLLCNPRRINALRESEFSISNLGIVLENAIEGFLIEEHAKYVEQQQDRAKLARKINQFALTLVEQEHQKLGEERAREILTPPVFDWYYRAGLLVLQNGYCSFIEPIIGDYFAARGLLTRCRNGRVQNALAQIAACPERWQRAIQIAANIWEEDISISPMHSLLSLLSPEYRLGVFIERRFAMMKRVEIVRDTLLEYFKQPNGRLDLIEKLLNDRDSVVQRTTIEAIREARYLSAKDALYNLALLPDQRPELQSQIATALTSLGDPRGEGLLPEEQAEIVEPSILQEDDALNENPLHIQTLVQKMEVENATGL